MKISQRITVGVLTIFLATVGSAIYKTARADSPSNVKALMKAKDDMRLNDYFNYGKRLAAIFNQAGTQTSDQDLAAIVNLAKNSSLTPEQLLLLDEYDILNINENIEMLMGVFDRVRNNYDKATARYYQASDKSQALIEVGNAIPYFAENNEFAITDMDLRFLMMVEQTLRLYPTLPNETKLKLANNYAEVATSDTPLVDIYDMPTDIRVSDLSGITLMAAGNLLPCMSADLLNTGVISDAQCKDATKAYLSLFGRGVGITNDILGPYDQNTRK